MIGAPLLMRIFLDGSFFTPDLAQQRESAIAFARLCLPQVFFYGMFVLLGQVLNARGSFGPMMWAPIANNVISVAVIGVYLWSYGPVRDLCTGGSVSAAVLGGPGSEVGGYTTGQELLLGIGSTLGIAVQLAILVPFLRRAGFFYRPRFDLRGSGLGHTLRLGSWTVAFVVVNQIAYSVVIRIASSGTANSATDVCGSGAVTGTGYTIYSNAFLLTMVPHSIATVSLATAMLPRLSAFAHDGDLRGVGRNVAATLRTTYSLIIPFALLLPLIAQPLSNLMIGYGAARGSIDDFALALALFSPGLVFFTAHYVMLRGFYALERTRTVFWVQCVIAATNIVLAVALTRQVGSRGHGSGSGYRLRWVLSGGCDLLLLPAAPGGRRARDRGAGAVPGASGDRGRDRGRRGVGGLARPPAGLAARLRCGCDLTGREAVRRGPAGRYRPRGRAGVPGARTSDADLRGHQRARRAHRTHPSLRGRPYHWAPSEPSRRDVTGTPFGPGSVLAGRFVLEDLLDESDGARFWRATDRILARNVAVHVLPDADPRADALLTAARSSALVSDPRLLRVLDAASADGVVYVVNEWGSGVSLDRLLAEGPLSPRRAAWVVKEVAEAISTAHRNGVAHGRLLPENVMISETGAVKVIGFVIDAVLRNPPGHGAGSGARRVTGGEPVSPHESDVLNLAGLLYAALVGRWPGTEGSTIPAAPTEHGRPLRPRQVRAGVPRPLDRICERVLAPGTRASSTPVETAHEVVRRARGLHRRPGRGPAGGRTATGRRGTPRRPRRDRPPGEPPDNPPDNPSDVDTGDLAPTGSFPPPSGSGSRPRRRTRAGSQPPPPPPEPPERPLFAEGPHAAASTAAASGDPPPHPHPTDGTESFIGEQRSTGAGNGRVPASWGPDPHSAAVAGDARHGDEGRADGMPGRSWLRLAVALAVLVVLVVAVASAITLGTRSPAEPPVTKGSPSPSATPAKSVRIPIAGVSDFDPLADPPEENGNLAPLAVDGKPDTAWRTVTYRNNPKLAGLKAGRRTPRRPRRPEAGRGSPPHPDGQPDLAGSAGSPRGLRRPDQPRRDDSRGQEDERPNQGRPTARSSVTTRWLVVWLTSLPPVPGGFQGRIAEIAVRT